MPAKKDEKHQIDIVSNSFLGIRTMGLFAPLSYWRSNTDTGTGDIDTLYRVIDFARKTGQGIIQMLPLNLPSADNCPYAIASNYILDPVYIGIEAMFDILGNVTAYSKAMSMYEAKTKDFSELKKNPKSTNDKTRIHKYEIFKTVFDVFQKAELKGDTIETVIFHKSEKNKGSLRSDFSGYCAKNKEWLFDHVLFFILVREYGDEDFRKWDDKVAHRNPGVIRSLKEKYNDVILFESFIQWMLDEQLTRVLRYAKNGSNPVDIMLDQPFAFGNADVWMNLKAFHINPKTLRKEYTQGAPPHRLDIPQHWQFTLLNFDKPFAKKLLLKRMEFLLCNCSLLRIDHLLGYYQMYYLSEDTSWKMTLKKMKIWDEISLIKKDDLNVREKRERIYHLITSALKDNLPDEVRKKVFDVGGNLRFGNVVLACRKDFPENSRFDKNDCGWYEVNSTEHSCRILYTLLNLNSNGEDYLEKIIKEDRYFLKPDDSIRIGFFNPGPGEEIVSSFMELAQSKGRELVFENLGLVPDKVEQSMKELGVSEFKPLYFGYQFFKGDKNTYWFDGISERDYCSFAIHDTVTIEGWWTGNGYWAEKKYYFSDEQQKFSVLNWLIRNNYLGCDEERSTEKLTDGTQRAVLSSVSDSNANMAVFMMPDIFKSGEEGIINIPGYRGFWTARSPVTIEELIDGAEGRSDDETVCRAVGLIRHLACYKNRNSVEKQFASSVGLIHIVRTNPVCHSGYKQIRFAGESFMVDVAIYGMPDNVSLILNDSESFMMTNLELKHIKPCGLNVFRAVIPVTENLLKTNNFKIYIDYQPGTDYGYLIGIPQNTDANPLSDTYGRIIV